MGPLGKHLFPFPLKTYNFLQTLAISRPGTPMIAVEFFLSLGDIYLIDEHVIRAPDFLMLPLLSHSVCVCAQL